MRVLLVEDQPAMLAQLRRILAALSDVDVVAEASTEEQALSWLESHPDDWDLALVDLFLAKGHGFNVLRRCQRCQPHQRAVVLSRYTRDPVRHYAMKAGADAVFDKVSEMDAFISYLKTLPQVPA